MNRSGRVVRRRLSPQERPCEASRLVRNRQFQEVLAEDQDEVVIGLSGGTSAFEAVERPTQGLEQAEVVEPPEPIGREAPEFSQDPLLRRPRDQLSVPADECLRLRDEPEVEGQLVFEPRAAQEPQGVVLEHRLPDSAQALGLEIAVAVERVDRLSAADALGDCVDGEVARREIGLNRPGQRREVNRAPVRKGNPPGAVALGERKGRARGLAGKQPRSPLGLRQRDIDVDDRPVERVIANGTADYPGLLAREQLLDELTNRRPPALRGQGRY